MMFATAVADHSFSLQLVVSTGHEHAYDSIIRALALLQTACACIWYACIEKVHRCYESTSSDHYTAAVERYRSLKPDRNECVGGYQNNSYVYMSGIDHERDTHIRIYASATFS